MSVRNSFRALTAASLALAVALPFLSSPAQAAPVVDKVSAHVVTAGNHVIVDVSSGSLAVDDGALVVRNNAGKTVETVPLSYTGKDAQTYPIDATVANGVAKLVPSTDAKRATATRSNVLEASTKPVAKKQKVICGPQTKKQRDKEALSELQTELSTAATIGGIAGAIIGAVIGLAVGPLLPVAGLLGGAIGAGGGLAGAAINGAFARYFGTINSKFKPKTCMI